jgi:hypothetical protein
VGGAGASLLDAGTWEVEPNRSVARVNMRYEVELSLPTAWYENIEGRPPQAPATLRPV